MCGARSRPRGTMTTTTSSMMMAGMTTRLWTVALLQWHRAIVVVLVLMLVLFGDNVVDCWESQRPMMQRMAKATTWYSIQLTIICLDAKYRTGAGCVRGGLRIRAARMPQLVGLWCGKKPPPRNGVGERESINCSWWQGVTWIIKKFVIWIASRKTNFVLLIRELVIGRNMP